MKRHRQMKRTWAAPDPVDKVARILYKRYSRLFHQARREGDQAERTGRPNHIDRYLTSRGHAVAAGMHYRQFCREHGCAIGTHGRRRSQ